MHAISKIVDCVLVFMVILFPLSIPPVESDEQSWYLFGRTVTIRAEDNCHRQASTDRRATFVISESSFASSDIRHQNQTRFTDLLGLMRQIKTSHNSHDGKHKYDSQYAKNQMQQHILPCFDWCRVCRQKRPVSQNKVRALTHFDKRTKANREKGNGKNERDL